MRPIGVTNGKAASPLFFMTGPTEPAIIAACSGEKSDAEVPEPVSTNIGMRVATIRSLSASGSSRRPRSVSCARERAR